MQIRTTAEWLAILDDLRRAEPDLPSRSEMIRRLVERARDGMDTPSHTGETET